MARRYQGEHNYVELAKAYCFVTKPNERSFDDFSDYLRRHPFAISPGQVKRFQSIAASFNADAELDDLRRYEILHENPLVRFDKVTLSIEPHQL